MDEPHREHSHRAATLPESPEAPHLHPPVSHTPDRRPARIGCVLLLLLMVGAAVYGGIYYSRHRAPAPGAKGGPEGKGKRPVPVTLAKAETGNVPVEIRVVGSVAPYRTVAITSQVGGQLLEVAFRQGDFVRQGQLLFQIDPRPLQAALDTVRAQMSRTRAQIEQARLTVAKDQALVKQAEANLARDQAQLSYAEAQNRRYGGLLNQGYVTAEQAEQQASTARSLAATVQSDRANVASVKAALNADASNVQILQATLEGDQANERNAMVQLGYTTIRAPLDGRTGSLNLYAGAVVKPNDTTALITIDQITPVYVSFAVPEKYLGEIRRLQRASPLPVQVVLGGQEGAERGRVSFIDNTVDTSTGTITLRATFPNPGHRLWPGHYVNVTLMLGRQSGVVLVPEQAVQPGQKGDYVFVVKPDNTVESRNVTVDRTVGGKAVITKGLKAGETVVTDGQLQLTPGAEIRVRGPEDEAPAGDASGAPERRRHRPSGSPGAVESQPGMPIGEPSGAPSSPAAGAPAAPATAPGATAPSTAPGAAEPAPAAAPSGRGHRHRPQ